MKERQRVVRLRDDIASWIRQSGYIDVLPHETTRAFPNQLIVETWNSEEERERQYTITITENRVSKRK